MNERNRLYISIEASKVLGKSLKDTLLKHLRAFPKPAKPESQLARISAVSNAILASDFSQNMESWLTKTFNEGIPSIYDKSADAVYNATHIGGSQLHRLHDGSHTIWGMWDKVQEASPDDNPLQEVLGFLTAYGKDLSSHVGMPLFGMSRDTYQTLSNSLSDTFSIPKPWLQDLLHVNAVEVLGTSVATIALALRWDKATTEEFSRLAASLGISSIVSANPLLGVVTLAATAKAFWHPEKDGDYGEVVEGLAKGGIGTGLFLATSAVAPGPVWTGMLAGLCVGAVVNRATSKVHASDVSEFISRTMKRTVISEDSTDIENI